jgi:hypothetical protein
VIPKIIEFCRSLADFRVNDLPTPFSMASLGRRAFNEHFLKKVLAYLAQGQTLTEMSSEYETLCNYGIINPVPT